MVLQCECPFSQTATPPPSQAHTTINQTAPCHHCTLECCTSLHLPIVRHLEQILQLNGRTANLKCDSQQQQQCQARVLAAEHNLRYTALGTNCYTLNYLSFLLIYLFTQPSILRSTV